MYPQYWIPGIGGVAIPHFKQFEILRWDVHFILFLCLLICILLI